MTIPAVAGSRVPASQDSKPSYLDGAKTGAMAGSIGLGILGSVVALYGVGLGGDAAAAAHLPAYMLAGMAAGIVVGGLAGAALGLGAVGADRAMPESWKRNIDRGQESAAKPFRSAGRAVMRPLNRLASTPEAQAGTRPAMIGAALGTMAGLLLPIPGGPIAASAGGALLGQAYGSGRYAIEH